jgi:lysozyme
MQISQRGIDLIVSFEGKHKLLQDGRYQAYLDTLAKPPVPTLYCGLTKGIKMGMVATEEECQRLFIRELAIYDDAVDDLVKVPMTQNAHDALVSFAYNCGVGALKGSTLLKLLNQGKYEQAAAQFARWNKAGGKVWPGLVRRRAAEAALFLEPMPIETPRQIIVEMPDGGERQLPETAMPQRVSESGGSVKEAVKESWTIRGAILTLFGGATQAYDWAFSAATEGGQEAVKLKTSFGPWEALFVAMKANLGLLAAAFVIIGCGIVIVRRLQAAHQGKVG